MSLINSINKMNNIILLLEDEAESLSPEFTKEFFFMNKTIDSFKIILINLRQIVQRSCNHIICKDYIDINPDVSREVKYCSICELTFKDY